MKKFLFLMAIVMVVVFLFSCSDIDNGNSVTGKITDSQGNPVANAFLYLTYDYEVEQGRPQMSFWCSQALPGNIELTIWDITSEEKIYNYLLENVSAGNYQVTWNAINDEGLKVCDGIYKYEITTSDRKTSGDLLLYGISENITSDNMSQYICIAKTDSKGNYFIDHDKLAFNYDYNIETTDPEGNYIVTLILSHKIKLFAVHKDHGQTQSGFFFVDEEDGAKIDLEFQ